MRGGQADVTRQRQLGGARARSAVQRGDHDLRKRLDRVVQAVSDAHQLEDLLLRVARAHRRVQDSHREELAAGSGEDDGLHLVVAAEAIDDLLQAEQDVAGEAVLIRGPIERDGDDAVIVLDA